MAPAFQNGVEVKCRHCGKSAGSNELTLDPVYRMMVCRKCVEERRLKENPVRSGVVPSSVKPSQVKPVQPAPKPTAVKTVSASGSKTNYKCKKCGYSFPFDADKGYPRNCPNCSTPISSNYNFF